VCWGAEALGRWAGSKKEARGKKCLRSPPARRRRHPCPIMSESWVGRSPNGGEMGERGKRLKQRRRGAVRVGGVGALPLAGRDEHRCVAAPHFTLMRVFKPSEAGIPANLAMRF